MALVPQIITNTQTFDITMMDFLDFNGKAVKIAAGATLNLFTVATDEDIAKSAHLKRLQALSLIAVVTTFSTDNTQSTAVSSIAGAVLADGTVAMTADLDLGSNSLLNATNVPAKEAAISAVDAGAVAAAASMASAQADAAVQTAAYVQVDAQSIADLANDLKAKYNGAQTELADLRSKYDIAILLINELKVKMDSMNA